MKYDQPLSWPAEIVRAPTSFEEFLSSIPLIAQLTRMTIWQARRRSATKNIEAQLCCRLCLCADSWTDDPEKREFSLFLAEVISEEIGWPSVAFIPEDLMEILCWPHRDGLDDVQLRFRIEEKIGLQLSEEQSAAISRMKFREAVEFLVSLKQ